MRDNFFQPPLLKFLAFGILSIFILNPIQAQTFLRDYDPSPNSGFSYSITFQATPIKRSEAGVEYSVVLTSVEVNGYRDFQGKTYPCSQLEGLCNGQTFNQINIGLKYECNGKKIGANNGLEFRSVGSSKTALMVPKITSTGAPKCTDLSISDFTIRVSDLEGAIRQAGQKISSLSGLPGATSSIKNNSSSGGSTVRTNSSASASRIIPASRPTESSGAADRSAMPTLAMDKEGNHYRKDANNNYQKISAQEYQALKQKASVEKAAASASNSGQTAVSEPGSAASTASAAAREQELSALRQERDEAIVNLVGYTASFANDLFAEARARKERKEEAKQAEIEKETRLKMEAAKVTLEKELSLANSGNPESMTEVILAYYFLKDEENEKFWTDKLIATKNAGSLNAMVNKFTSLCYWQDLPACARTGPFAQALMKLDDPQSIVRMTGASTDGYKIINDLEYAISKGYAPAIYKLASFYETHETFSWVSKRRQFVDPDKALELYRRAMKSGHIEVAGDARRRIALGHRFNRMVEKDKALAEIFFAQSRTAERDSYYKRKVGNKESMFFRIRNSETNLYLNIENGDELRCSQVGADNWSAMWIPEAVADEKSTYVIGNRWKDRFIVSEKEQPAALSVNADEMNVTWIFEPVSNSQGHRLKHPITGHYLQIYDGNLACAPLLKKTSASIWIFESHESPVISKLPSVSNAKKEIADNTTKADKETFNKVLGQFVTDFNSGEFEKIFETFSLGMKRAVPLDKAVFLFSKIKAEGMMIRKAEPKEEHSTFTSYLVTCETAAYIMKIFVNSDAQITMLYFSPAS